MTALTHIPDTPLRLYMYDPFHLYRKTYSRETYYFFTDHYSIIITGNIIIIFFFALKIFGVLIFRGTDRQEGRRSLIATKKNYDFFFLNSSGASSRPSRENTSSSLTSNPIMKHPPPMPVYTRESFFLFFNYLVGRKFLRSSKQQQKQNKNKK